MPWTPCMDCYHKLGAVNYFKEAVTLVTQRQQTYKSYICRYLMISASVFSQIISTEYFRLYNSEDVVFCATVNHIWSVILQVYKFVICWYITYMA